MLKLKISGERNINAIHQYRTLCLYTGCRNIGIRICEHVWDDQNEVWDCKWHRIFLINFSTNHRAANKVFASHVNAVLLQVDSYAYFLRKKTFYIIFHANFHKYYYSLCFLTKNTFKWTSPQPKKIRVLWSDVADKLNRSYFYEWHHRNVGLLRWKKC